MLAMKTKEHRSERRRRKKKKYLWDSCTICFTSFAIKKQPVNGLRGEGGSSEQQPRNMVIPGDIAQAETAV